MRPVLEMIARVGPSDANVLITGENGTGKGVVARALHAVSRRATRPLVTVNVGGLSEGALRERAVRPRQGRVHRRPRRPRGPLRAGRRRNALPRRDRERPAQPAGQASARPRDRRVRARGLLPHAARSTCGCSPPRTADLGRGSRAGRFRQDLYFRLRTRSRSASRRCASAARTSRFWPATSSPRTRSDTESGSTGSTSGDEGAPARTPGRATSASSITPSKRAVLMAAGRPIRAADLGLRRHRRPRAPHRRHEPRRRRSAPHPEGPRAPRRQRQPRRRGPGPEPKRVVSEDSKVRALAQPGWNGANQPTSQPANQPTSQPANQPTSQPANQPTSQPANQPTSQPANQPTSQPANTASKDPAQ